MSVMPDQNPTPDSADRNGTPAENADRDRNGRFDGKVTAERDEAFVVFHIGMRINALWKVHRWLPILLVAPRMVRELVADDASGLLGSRTVVGPGLRNVGFVQYWDSFESLRAYARDSDRLHVPAWQAYYGDGTAADGAVGIWHETYRVEPDEYETVYNNVPAHGLAACAGSEVLPATGRRRYAADRMGDAGRSDASDGAAETR